MNHDEGGGGVDGSEQIDKSYKSMIRNKPICYLSIEKFRYLKIYRIPQPNSVYTPPSPPPPNIHLVSSRGNTLFCRLSIFRRMG